MKQNEIIYNSLFDLIPIPSWIYDLESYNILDVNRAAINHYGYNKDEFLQLNLKDLRPVEEIPKFMAAHASINKVAGNNYIGIYTHKKKSGEHIKMKINGHIIEFSGKKCMLVACQDVTQEEEILQQLKLSGQRLNAATAIAKLGYWRLELNANTLSWTDEIFKIWGRDRADFEVNYKNFSATIHPEDRAAFEEKQDAAFAGKKELDFVHRIILPDKSLRWVYENGRLIHDEKGNPIAFEGTVQDITSLKIEEQRLKLLESVITNTNDAILITEAEPFDEPGPRILYVNDAFTKMTGYTSEEVIGRSPRLLQGPNSDRKELARLGKAIRNWESCEVTTVNYKKNGEEFWINFSVSPVVNEKGGYTHWIAIERDVTEQKQKELEKELFSKISLDFRSENGLNIAAESVCNTLSEYGKFDLVEIWTTNLEKNRLFLYCHFLPDAADEQLYIDNHDKISFERSEGLPGKVWTTKAPLLLTNVTSNNDFLRKDVAKKMGLEHVLGIPLISNNEVVGVLVVGTKHTVYRLEKYLKLFKKLETFIGSEINRKKLENDLGHLYNSIPDILCLMDFQNRFLKINKAGCELLHLPEEEILYHSFNEFVHPDDKEISFNELKKLETGETNVKFENRFITKTGTIWLSWTCNIAVDEGLIYASAKNITENAKLRELNRMANSLARIGSWEIDLLNKKLYWSDMVHALHKTDPKFYVPEYNNAVNFHREDFREMVREVVANCGTTGEPFDFESVIITTTNDERWIRAIGNAEFANGVCRRMYGSFQDIHASKTMELQIREILGSISDAFGAVDKNWNFTFFNKEAENVLFLKAADVLGKNIWDLFPAIKSTILEKSYFRVAETGIPESFEYLYPVNEKWYDLNIYPSNGGISTYFKNIDERKQAAEQLKLAYEEKNTILESIGDAFFSVTKGWIVSYWNKEAEVVIGKHRDDILGKNLWEEYPDTIDSDFYRKYQEAMETQQNIRFEEYYATLNMWVEVSAYPTPLGLSVYFKDITLRKETDIRILQANERFEKATEATNDAIWDWDIIEGTLYWGGSYKKIFGYDIDKIKPTLQTWTDHIHPEDIVDVELSLTEVLENPNQQTWEKEYHYKKMNGVYACVIDKGVIIRNNEGKAVRMVGSMTDISDRKNQESQLLALNEALKKHAHDLEVINGELEQFAYIASHDLQEPLRMITSFLDQLKRKYNNSLDEKAHQYIHFATDGAKRMKQIILDLLEYSRAGRVATSIEEVDMNEVLEHYKLLRTKIIAEKNAILNIGHLPTLQTYKAPLTQTIHSLLDNAIKYAKKDQPSQVSITAEERENDWLIIVQDKGIGIATEYFDKIFILFQRLHNRDEYEGTGIGLPIAKKHVESWGGKIWLESEPGIGSTFYFTHPKALPDKNK